MHRSIFTSRYSKAIMCISMMAIVLVLGHDAVLATNAHDHAVDAAHQSIAVEQCVLTEGLDPQASVHPTFAWELAPSSQPHEGLVANLTSSHTDTAAFPPSSEALRISLQVFLN